MDWLAFGVAFVGLGGLSILVVFLVAAWQASRRPRVLCLMYHRMVPRAQWGGLRGLDRIFSVPTEELDAQLGWLAAEGFRFVAAADVAAFARGDASLGDRSILLTVDDGCLSARTGLLPLLRKHGVSAILFVTTDAASGIFEGGERRLSDDEIRELCAGGVEIGSHAVSHRPLSAMDESGIRRELGDSKRQLEAITGRPVRHFAVPSNWYDDRVLRIAAEVGYESVFCSLPGTVRPGGGAFGLPRLNVEGSLDLAGFRKAISPLAIAQRRLVLQLRGLPKRLVGPTGWTRLRRVVFRHVSAERFSPSRMAGAGIVVVALGLGLALAMLLFRD